jgi:hypothetical protein
LETDVITGLLLRSTDGATSPHKAVLFHKTWPVWLPVIPSLGLRVSILVLTDHRCLFPELHPPVVSPGGPTFAFFGPHMRVPKFGTSFWECYPNLTDVIFCPSLLPRFYLPADWHTSSVTLSHSAMGGTTSSNVTACALVRKISRDNSSAGSTCVSAGAWFNHYPRYCTSWSRVLCRS